MRGPTLRSAGFHQANLITTEVQAVKNYLQKVQNSINDNQSVLQELVNYIGSSETPKTSNTTPHPNSSPHGLPPDIFMPQANTAFTMPQQSEMPSAMFPYL